MCSEQQKEIEELSNDESFQNLMLHVCGDGERFFTQEEILADLKIALEVFANGECTEYVDNVETFIVEV